MKRLIFFGFLILWFFGFLAPIRADTTLSVSPPVVEVLIAPNKKVSQTFTLQTSGETTDIVPELHLAKPEGDSGHMTIDPSPLNPSSLPLIITMNPTGAAERLDSRAYTITFEAASTDVVQDVYLALVFRTSPLESSVSNLTSLSPAISSLILVTINPAGVVPINLEIKDFDSPLFHDSWSPLTLTPKLENKEGIMIRPQGKYEVINPAGKTVLDLPLYPNLILGHSSRLLTSNVSNLASSLTWFPHWSNIGPYRLRLTITTEGGTQITQVEKTIWILPIRLTIISIIFLILFIIFLIPRSNPPPTTLDKLSIKTYS